MKRNSLVRNLALLGALAFTVPAFAKPVTKSLPISQNVKVGKVDVKAGDYRATIDDNHITLLNGKKVVAESAGRWETATLHGTAVTRTRSGTPRSISSGSR